MGNQLVEDDVGRLHTAVGFLRSEVGNLSDRMADLKDSMIEGQRKVHDIISAQSEAVRNLDREVREIRPLFEDYRLKSSAIDEAVELTDDYKEGKAEKRGEDRYKNWLFTLAASAGGLLAVIVNKLWDLFSTRPHP